MLEELAGAHPHSTCAGRTLASLALGRRDPFSQTMSMQGTTLSTFATPLSILLGFGLVAFALYARGPGEANGMAKDASVREAERPARTPEGVLAPSSETRPLPAKVHTPHGLRTLFRPHTARARELCRPDLKPSDPEAVVAEIPMVLTIDADGAVTSAKPKGRGRVIGADGAMRPRDFGAEVSLCYAARLKEWLRFPRASSGSEIEAPLRILDAM